MVVTMVHIWVKEQFVEEFIKATIDNHENTIKEPGNIRFDFLSDLMTVDPTFYLFRISVKASFSVG